MELGGVSFSNGWGGGWDLTWGGIGDGAGESEV